MIRYTNGQFSKKYPLVSCIMPTRNRRNFIPRSIHYFIRQDYPNKELIIVDDGEYKVHDLIPINKTITYINLNQTSTIGEKRNIAIEHSKGDYVIHWDDDDWFAKNRITLQMEFALQKKCDFVGLNKMIFWNILSNKAWLFESFKSVKPWLAGGSLCYRKAVWIEKKFDDISYGEDTFFVWNRDNVEVNPIPDIHFYIAIIHKHNIISKKISSKNWQPYPLLNCQNIMGSDFQLYQND